MMDKVLKELEEFRKDIDKIKEFCVLVATEHNHIPGLKHAWHDESEELIYKTSRPWNKDLNNFTGKVLKALLHLEERLDYLEDREHRNP